MLPPKDNTNNKAHDTDDEELRSWAIQFKPSELEKALWDARGVKIYDVDINEFVKQLREEEK